MSTFSEIQGRPDVDISGLLTDLASNDPVTRDRSRESLVGAGHEAVIPLIHALKSPSARVRWEAAKALGAIKDESAANALVQLLDDDEHEVRWVAAQALVGLGSEGLKQTLIALLTKSDSLWVREGAHHVLLQFARLRSGQFLTPLLPLFHGFEPAVSVPAAALKALHELQDRAGPA